MTNICHPLHGICISLNLVGSHLEKRQWISGTLDGSLLPQSVDIIYRDVLDNEAREDSLPIIAYDTTEFTFSNPQVLTRPLGGNMQQLSGGLRFTVSTTNKALTRELAFEIGALFSALRADLTKHNFYASSIVVSPTQKDEHNYYIATTTVTASLGYPIWKTEYVDGILREISINLNTH